MMADRWFQWVTLINALQYMVQVIHFFLPKDFSTGSLLDFNCQNSDISTEKKFSAFSQVRVSPLDCEMRQGETPSVISNCDGGFLLSLTIL